MNVQIILSQMLMLFAMMLIGYVIWKKQWMDENSYQNLSRIVVNIFNPLLVIYGVVGKNAAGSTQLLMQNLGFVLLFYIILILISYGVVWLLRPRFEEKKIYRLMMIFPNVGFMGIPVITSIYGTECMIYIVFYMLGYNLLLYTYGIVLARKAGEDAKNVVQNTTQRGSFWRIINAGVVASLADVVIFLCQISVPVTVISFLDYMGNATIPLSMLLIGMSIARADLKKIFMNKKAYLFTMIKMLIIPIAAAVLLKPLGADPVIFGVFVLQLAMPVGSIITLIAKENGADEICCTNGIVLSTLASIATIPLVCLFLS